VVISAHSGKISKEPLSNLIVEEAERIIGVGEERA
jgi:hypothetical protein